MHAPTLFAGWMFAWLGTYAVHGTLLLGIAWLASRVVRSPGARDTLWKTALAGALVTSTLSVGMNRPAGPETVLRRRILPPGAVPATLTPPRLPAQPGPLLPPWVPGAAIAVWLAGAAVGIARLEAGRRRYWRMAGARHAVADAESADALRRLRATAGVERTIYLTTAEGLEAPAAVGFAEICLPAAALGALTPAQRESVLAHELGHIVRRDPLWKVAVEAAAAIFWFQPLLRVARREMVECAELLCDGFAVRVTGRRRPLVESLGVLAAAFHPHGVAAAGFGDAGSPLLRRAARVMDATRAPAGPLPAAARGVLAAVALAGTLAFSPAVEPPPLMRVMTVRTVTLDRTQLNADRNGVAGVDPGGSFRFSEESDGVRREVTVRRGADGKPAYDYRENGIARPFDAAAQAWLRQAMDEARERPPRISITP